MIELVGRLQLHWKDFFAWPVGAKLALIIFACTLLSVVGFFMFLQPKWKQLQRNINQMGNIQLELNNAGSTNTLKMLKQKVKILQSELDSNAKQSINSSNHNGVIADIYATAANNSIKVEFIEPGDSFKLQVQAEYFALLQFMQALYALPYAFSLQKISMVSKQGVITMLLEMV